MNENVATRPWTALGIAVSTSVLVLIAVGYRVDALAGIGWGGGEYAYLFFFAAIGLVVAGALMLAFGGRRPWRWFGIGTITGGVVGVLVVAGALVWLVYAFSHWTF
jgi:hypothetical protein